MNAQQFKNLVLQLATKMFIYTWAQNCWRRLSECIFTKRKNAARPSYLQVEQAKQEWFMNCNFFVKLAPAERSSINAVLVIYKNALASMRKYY